MMSTQYKETLKIVGIIAVAMLGAVSVMASSFPIAGGSYTANVAVRVATNGTQLSSATGVINGTMSVQAVRSSRIIDTGGLAWQIGSGFNSASESVVMTVALDSIYEINRIHTFCNAPGFTASNHQLRVSTDNSNWITVLSPTVTPPTTRIYTNTFATQPTKFIEWTMFGPGSFIGEYAYPQELQAFVSSTAATAPDLTDGYNVIKAGTIIQSVNGTLALAFDSDPETYAIPNAGGTTNVIDLGSSVALDVVRFRFFSGVQTWSNTTVSVSQDLVNWTTVFSTNSTFSDGQFVFTPTQGRYVRLGTRGTGALFEFSAFASIPEPSTVLLFVLAEPSSGGVIGGMSLIGSWNIAPGGFRKIAST